ncbi:hypothetical protein COY52_10975, partial [Candidatus Desantisbacteria bacterium CG_4_10_14_0_8_um_filter_48_22]
TFTINAVDPIENNVASGIAFIEYQVDGETWTIYSSPFSLADGMHFVNYKAVDRAGNSEDTRMFMVTVGLPKTDIRVESPVYTNPYNNNIYLTSASTVSLVVVGDASQVQRIEYRLDTETIWNTYTDPFTIPSAGFHMLSCYTVDILGGVEQTINMFNLYVDDSPPIMQIGFIGPFYNTSPVYVSALTTATLYTYDLGSGPKWFEYKVDNNVWETGVFSASFNLGSEETHTILCRGTDNLGNIGAINTFSVFVDNIPPASSYSIGIPQYIIDSGVYISSTTPITLSAHDTSAGLGVIRYRIDNTPDLYYSQPFALTSQPEGQHVVSYYSLDNLGNMERTNSFTFFVDNAPPLSQLEITGPQYGTAPVYIASVTSLNVTGIDNLTGLKRIEYKLDGAGAWAAGLSPTVVNIAEEGTHTLWYRSIDNVENIEEAHSIIFFVDNSPPATNVDIGQPIHTNSDTWVTSYTPITLTADDSAGCGLERIEYMMGETGVWQTYANSFVLLDNGAQRVLFRSFDNLGNREEIYSSKEITSYEDWSNALAMDYVDIQSSQGDVVLQPSFSFSAWDVEYEANILPNQDASPWQEVFASGSYMPESILSGGILYSGTQDPNSSHAWRMGISSVDPQVGVTAEARIKIDSAEGWLDAALRIADGRYEADLIFHPAGVLLSHILEEVVADNYVFYEIDNTQDFHKYTLTLKNGIARVYLDGGAQPILEWNAVDKGVTDKYVLFGDITTQPEWTSSARHSENWDYVRFTTQAPVFAEGYIENKIVWDTIPQKITFRPQGYIPQSASINYLISYSPDDNAYSQYQPVLPNSVINSSKYTKVRAVLRTTDSQYIPVLYGYSLIYPTGEFKSETLCVDNIPPAGSIIINNGDIATGKTQVTLKLTAQDTGCGLRNVLVSNSSDFSDSLSLILSGNTIDTQIIWTIPEGEGDRVVYIRYEDNLGNTSAYSDNIQFDITPPVSSLSIGSPKVSVDTLTYVTSVTPFGFGAEDTISGVSSLRYGIGLMGQYDYFFASKWQLPSGSTAIAIDKFNNIYVSDRINNHVYKFSSDGTLITTLNIPLSSGHMGMAVDDSGNIYVSAGFEGLKKYDSNGNYITTFESALGGPCYYVAVDNYGYVYAIYTTSDRMVGKFKDDGTYITSWGGQDQFLGNFAIGIAVDSKHNVYVTDYSGNPTTDSESNRIQKFTSDGTFTLKWGGYGSEPGKFIDPICLAVDKEDNIYVADMGNHRIQKFDNNGTFLASWGTYGTEDGQFVYPNGIAVDSFGNVYISDYFSNRIQGFTPQTREVWKTCIPTYNITFAGEGIIKDGLYPVKYYSIDQAGNSESIKTQSIILDNSAPTVTLAIGCPHYPEDTDVFHITNVSSSTTYSITCSDAGVGVDTNTIKYRIISSMYTYTYTQPFTLPSSIRPLGSFNIYWWAVDKLGNTSPMYVVSNYRDDSPPATAISLSGLKYFDGANTYVSIATTFTLVAQDRANPITHRAGLKSTAYKVNEYETKNISFAAKTYAGTTTFNLFKEGIKKDGECTITYYSTDNVQNKEEMKFYKVIADNAAPTFAITVSPSMVTDTSSVHITILASERLKEITEAKLTQSGAVAVPIILASSDSITLEGNYTPVVGYNGTASFFIKAK